MHFRRLQLLILPSHCPLLLSILSAIKYSMHRAASRTKQVKISITKNAHVLPCPATAKGEWEGEWERESGSAEADVTAPSQKKLLERVLGASCCLLPTRCACVAAFPSASLVVFLGSEPRCTCPENYPLNAACQLGRSFLRSLRLISVNHTAQCWGM